jgi:hypothetical protein
MKEKCKVYGIFYEFRNRAYNLNFSQNLGTNTPRPVNAANVQSSCERLVTISDLKTEERRQKLSRYRKKKIKRDFGRKIKVQAPVLHLFLHNK